jgi:hypothetical protein
MTVGRLSNVSMLLPFVNFTPLLSLLLVETCVAPGSVDLTEVTVAWESGEPARFPHELALP